MIDPFTAITAATTAFKTVQKFVQAGQDFENTVGQMGKWYTAVSDFRRGQQMQKKPPLFKKLFNAGKIRSPIHLYSNNEDFLIKFFKRIKKNDWIFCSWRSHYQCLLKGVPPKELKKEIIEGKSISLCFPKYKIYSSAIVGGVLPISVGLALSLKRKKSKHKVYCFLGDMTSETGIAHESIKYSINKKLPIHFISEDNSKSVCTDTKKLGP